MWLDPSEQISTDLYGRIFSMRTFLPFIDRICTLKISFWFFICICSAFSRRTSIRFDMHADKFVFYDFLNGFAVFFPPSLFKNLCLQRFINDCYCVCGTFSTQPIAIYKSKTIHTVTNRKDNFILEIGKI